MSLDDKIEKSEHKDAWVKEGSSGLLGKIGRGITLATLGITATFGSVWGVAYGLGAEWAQDIKGYFDEEYNHYISGKRDIESDWESKSTMMVSDDGRYTSIDYVLLSTNSQNRIQVNCGVNENGDIKMVVFHYTGIKDRGKEILFFESEEDRISKELQLALYDHIHEKFRNLNRYNLRSVVSEVKCYILAFNTFVDKDEKVIEDSNTFIELYELFVKSKLNPATFRSLLEDIHKSLPEKTWQETAQILRKKYQ